MKYNKTFSRIGIASGCLGAAVSAFAAATTSTEVAPLQKLLPNAYSDFELRHFEEYDGEQDKRKEQARYILGSTFFDNMLKSELIFGVNKYADRDGVVYRGTRSESELTLFSSKYVSILSHLEAKLPHENYGTNATWGFVAPVSVPFSSRAGVLTPEVAIDAVAYLGSRPAQVPLRTEVGMAPLSEDVAKSLDVTMKEGKYTAAAPSGKYETEYTAKLTYVPSFLPKLTAYAKGYYRHTYVPQVSLAKDQKSVVNDKQYAAVFSKEHRINVKYDINKTLYVVNDLFIRDRAENGKAVYENALVLGAHLF